MLHTTGGPRVTTQSTTGTTDTREQGGAARETAAQMAQGARESAQRLAEQTREAWQQAREEPTPQGIMGALEQLPSSFYLYATLGSIGLSLLLRIAGRKELANFVGLWPPTILSLAMLNKTLRPSREMQP
jgi:hypothetical protein